MSQVPQLCSRILDDPVFEKSINMKGFFIGNPGINSDVCYIRCPAIHAQCPSAAIIESVCAYDCVLSLTECRDCCSGITMSTSSESVCRLTRTICRPMAQLRPHSPRGQWHLICSDSKLLRPLQCFFDVHVHACPPSTAGLHGCRHGVWVVRLLVAVLVLQGLYAPDASMSKCNSRRPAIPPKDMGPVQCACWDMSR